MSKYNRYLVVVDDVWSVPAWEAIRIRLPDNNYGSRIIVTTRIGTVARAASDSVNFIHHMEPLESAASKKLFVQRAFGSTKKRTCPTELEPFMDKILKQCGGLPLAIISIASLLASYNSDRSIDMWKRVSSSSGLQMESHPTLEGMRKLIALSYDYLPHHLKACMMYMSIFPEDRVIAKSRLLYRWIAEGLIAKKRGLTLFEVAEDYFNELTSRNMIQPDKFVVDNWINERVEACRVHDMMLEVMVSKSLETNFVSLVGRLYREMTYGKVRRLSIHDDSVELKPKKRVKQRRASERHGIEAMKLHHVRSLTTFQSEGLEKLLDRLGEFKLLRVLDMEGCMSLEDKNMRDVCRLYLLRFLSLRGTKISVMPSEVGDLQHLEALDVEKSRIRDLPPTVTMLTKLELLKCDSWTLPRGLEKMKALREVSKAILADDIQIAQEIGELQQLQVLIMELTRRDLDPEERFWFALGSSLSKTYSLRWLHMEGSTSSTAMNSLLRVTSPPPLLQRLTINGAIRKMPDWISTLSHLVEFSMERGSLDADQIFDILCKLPNLQIIELGTWSCIDKELIGRTAYKFPELRILNVSATSTSPEVLRFEEGCMTKVEQLVLTFNRDKRILVGINNLKNLKEVKLNGTENDPALIHAMNQLKRENESRSKYNQIKIVVDYR